MDIEAFRQMVAKNPRGFLGRYGLGNKILQEGGNLEEAVAHLRVAVQAVTSGLDIMERTGYHPSRTGCHEEELQTQAPIMQSL
jgi:hypothetical protein